MEIVNKFKYLGIVFTDGGSFNSTYEGLNSETLKAIFKQKPYIVKSQTCQTFLNKIYLINFLSQF